MVTGEGRSQRFPPFCNSVTRKGILMDDNLDLGMVDEDVIDPAEEDEEGFDPLGQDDLLDGGEVGAQTIGHKGATLMMHMTGSRMYHNDNILKTIEMDPFLPDSETYVPVTHSEIVDEVKHNVRRFFDVPIKEEYYALSASNTKEFGMRVGARMFGLLIMDMSTGDADDDFSLCVGIKNALDGSTRAAVCIGHQVFVCDNLAFSGQLMSSHRHTKNIHNVLPGLILNTIKQGPDQFFKDQELKKRLKAIDLVENQGYKILCDMAVKGILKTSGNNKSQFVQAVKHHKIPPFAVFADKTAWSLLNAVTFGIQQNTNPAGIIHSSNDAVEYFRGMAKSA